MWTPLMRGAHHLTSSQFPAMALPMAATPLLVTPLPTTTWDLLMQTSENFCITLTERKRNRDDIPHQRFSGVYRMA